MNAEANRYDEVSYQGFAYAQTHPDRLAVIATLFGMTPAPAERCRVLELGCGDGTNLLPMAAALPESSFVGLDLAGQPIAAGRTIADRLGLKNLELMQKDVMGVTSDLGRFDYIVAHGLYAWVPPPVQEKVLAICRDNLAPDGVAYVSYNAYPGCRLREMFRDMMQYHVRAIEEPPKRVAQAKAFIKFLRQSLSHEEEYGSWMLKDMERMEQQSGGSLFHDQLSENYRPCYFHQFMERAAGHRLQYLGEADFLEMNDEQFPQEAIDALRAFGPDQFLVKEQYMDFLKMRRFRQTLLCHEKVLLRRRPALEDLSPFHVSTRARAVAPGGDPESPEAVEYRTAKGASMKTDVPGVKRLMARLEQAWPGSVPFRDLARAPATVEETARLTIQMYQSAIVDLRLSAPRFVVEPGPRPAATGLCRFQVDSSSLVTNQLHNDVKMDGDLPKAVLRLLDGTRDRAALLRELAQAGTALTAERLETCLRQLARTALLTA